MSLETPFAAQNVFEQQFAPIAGFIECPVIGTHHSFDPSLRNQFFESRQISIVKFTFGDYGVEGVAISLRSGMDSVMLGAGRGFEIFGMVTLQAFRQTPRPFRR